MLIPKCCKNCSGRKSGMCYCTLPLYCNEWVEGDETYTENKKEWYDFKPTYEQSIGNWGECPDCKEKDHRIAVLERALEMVCEKYARFSVPMYSIEYLKLYHIERAKKELEGKE